MKRLLIHGWFVCLAATAIVLAIGCGGEEPSSRASKATSPILFDHGFYNDETFPGENATVHHFRWMGASATAQLPPSPASASLKFTLGVPVEALPKRPAIAITLNGVSLDSFIASKTSYERAYVLTAAQLHPDQPNSLTFSTTQTIVPAQVTNGKNSDSRALGLQITDLHLEPVP